MSPGVRTGERVAQVHIVPASNAARLAIFDYIERFYNPIRRHSTLGNISPIDYELTAAGSSGKG